MQRGKGTRVIPAEWDTIDAAFEAGTIDEREWALEREWATGAYDDAFRFSCEPDWSAITLGDATEWAAEFSAADPDAYHPPHVLALLRVGFGPERPDYTVPARDAVPEVERLVVDRQLAEVAEENAAAAGVQLGLVFDTTPQDDEVRLALGRAFTELGRVPTLRDVQRRRVGLPPVETFDAVGGFRAAVRRWRAEVGVA